MRATTYRGRALAAQARTPRRLTRCDRCGAATSRPSIDSRGRTLCLECSFECHRLDLDDS